MAYEEHMRQEIVVSPDYIRAEMVGRRTADETKEFVTTLLEALRNSDVRKVLVSVKSSTALFTVEKWDLPRALDEMSKMGGLRVALVSDSQDLEMAHKYVTILAFQRGLTFKVFRAEQDATAWLLE